MSKQRILVDNRLPSVLAERLASRWPECEFKVFDDRGSAPPADALIHWGSSWPSIHEYVKNSRPNLRWVHTWAAGVDEALMGGTSWLGSAIFTNSRGAQGPAVSEYVLARIIHFEWFGGKRTVPWTEVAARKVAVLGYGSIGTAIGDALRRVGIRLVALVRRSTQPLPTEVEIQPPQLWLDALSDVDYLVVAVPLTQETRSLIDETWFAALRRGAVLVNVARGGIVDTNALVRALDSGKLAGAYLDVTDPEPLPDDHPLRGHEHCVITPHIAGSSAEARDRTWQILERNLSAFCTGSAYINVVDVGRGY